MAELFLPLFIAFFCAEIILDISLNRLNASYIGRHPELPRAFKGHIDEEEYQRSRRYTLSNLNFGIVSSLIGSGITIFILFSGILPWIDQHCRTLSAGLSSGVLFLWSITLLQSIIGLPLNIYRTFKIEAAFGFNKMSAKLFISDLCKGLLLSSIIGLPLLYAVLWFVQSAGQWWWLITALFMIGFQVVMMLIYPLLIAPLFNKFSPLEEGELKEQLLQLATKLEFGARDIYVMDGSRRSGHSNAYFTGFGKMRRIVLYDTLIEQLQTEELVAVLAHEIGHYKKHHVLKMVMISSILMALSLYLFSLALNWQPLYSAFGFATPSHAVGLFLFFTAFGTFTFIFSPLSTILSRRHEYQADAYAAAACGSPAPLIAGLIRLAEKNLSNLTPHPLYSFFHYSHPTITERIAALTKERL